MFLFWFASRPVQAVAFALAAGAALLSSGCYRAHLCGASEECNGRDDDCDGLVDEDFKDERGLFSTVDRCGGCDIACAQVFPTAAEVACEVDESAQTATCRLASCPEGERDVGGACALMVPVTCLPCTAPSDCTLRDPSADCWLLGGDGLRCVIECNEDSDCPDGTECASDSPGHGACLPIGGDCRCNEGNLGLEMGCIYEGADLSHQCAGVQICEPGGFSDCQAAFDEVCNEQDDDCDGEIDEDFRDAAGLYVHRMNCGGCGIPCVPPGPNMAASCDVIGGVATCGVACVDGFVDVDGIPANGCECERWDGEGPPPVVGGDADCDGIPDDVTTFIFVTTSGNDTSPGTLAQPMRTIAAAAARAASEGKAVLVARGIYDGGLDLVAGVDLYGGYRTDFADRDLELYPVYIEKTGVEPGMPVVMCSGVSAPTRVDGFTVMGADAVEPGNGSTAVYVRECASSVVFANLIVFAGRGADGVRGGDSSDRLTDWGLGSLGELDGVDGVTGLSTGASDCARLRGGSGGSKSCRGSPISGGAGADADCPNLGCTNGLPCGNSGCTDFTVGGVCDVVAMLEAAVSNPAASNGEGDGGGAAGGVTYNSPTNRADCSFCDDNPTLRRTGEDGQDGALGAAGTGGIGCNTGTSFDVATGRITGGAGSAGADGTDGAGGGGGSSGSGYAVIGGTFGGCVSRSGGSGGGSGSGGCGAPGALGGTGGGSSVAVAIRLAAGVAVGPRFENVRIVTASGGSGGDGGRGAQGGAAGVGAAGGVARFWCARNGGRGGDGGRGGTGGGGGGGCGGSSYAFAVSAPSGVDAAYRSGVLGGQTVDRAGVAGSGGAGGFSPGQSGADGTDGSTADVGDDLRN